MTVKDLSSDFALKRHDWVQMYVVLLVKFCKHIFLLPSNVTSRHSLIKGTAPGQSVSKLCCQVSFILKLNIFQLSTAITPQS